MTHAVFGAAATFNLYQLHKSLGFVALALTTIRLVARFFSRAPRPVPGWEGLLSRAVQAAFYVLTFCAIGAGWLVVSASPLPIPTNFFGLFVVPNVAPPDPALFASAKLAHQAAAYAIAALVALHVAGALKHHLVDRDDTLRRMLKSCAFLTTRDTKRHEVFVTLGVLHGEPPGPIRQSPATLCSRKPPASSTHRARPSSRSAGRSPRAGSRRDCRGRGRDRGFSDRSAARRSSGRPRS